MLFSLKQKKKKNSIILKAATIKYYFIIKLRRGRSKSLCSQ